MFWRRGGGRFDKNANSLGGVLLRGLVLVFVLVCVVLMVRLWLSAAEASSLSCFMDAGWNGAYGRHVSDPSALAAG